LLTLRIFEHYTQTLQTIRVSNLSGSAVPIVVGITVQQTNVAPRLSISRTNVANLTNVIVSWPNWASNYVLQQNLNLRLGSNGWSTNTNSIISTNGSNVVTIPVNTNRQYFRLIK
jgi:hypothetical protein